eukprot:12367478-Alexandrium_andersonii.AAC.1
MSASLVGSEMCIRDRVKKLTILATHPELYSEFVQLGALPMLVRPPGGGACLLYTSDAADDM